MEKKPESIFINRELSWLDFDSRVLALAKEKTVPLGERIKFAAIFGSNMDEFFMVRVGSLYDQTLLKNNKTDNVTHMTAAEQIAAITPRVAELQAKCDKYFQHLVTALAAEGYRKVDFAKLSKPQEHFWKTYFQRELFPLLSPQIVDSRHPFPFLNNKDIYYIAQLHTKNEGVSYGIVPVSSQFERVLFVKDGETACFAFVEELIAHYAATIFSASTVTKQCLFRVTRNADITVDEGMMDHDVDFRDVMSELLKKRRKLAAVRLQFWPDAPQEIVKFLRDKLVVPADRCYTQTSPLDSGALFKLAGRISGDGGHTELFYPTARPMQAPAGYDLYTEVRKHDVLLAYPYQSIRPFIKMLLRAGADKVSVNSAALKNPQLIADAAYKFGSQCVVVAIDAKRREDGTGWNVYKNGGRIDVGLDAVSWAAEAEHRGAGEILLTSMDCDGTKAGYDNELTSAIAETVDIPVIASGGAGTKEHFYDTLTEGKADAALAASLFHFKELEIMELKDYLADRGLSMRR